MARLQKNGIVIFVTLTLMVGFVLYSVLAPHSNSKTILRVRIRVIKKARVSSGRNCTNCKSFAEIFKSFAENPLPSTYLIFFSPP